MRGGAQSHLMRASDGHYYVVKFQNNPQHVRVLANEFLATRLAERLGLPVPAVEIIEVGKWLIEHTPELRMQQAGKEMLCGDGLQFGARYVGDIDGEVFDYLPESLLERLRNRADFARMLVLDKWTCNSNGRQAVFTRQARQRNYQAIFIDQGYCFNAGEWSFPDSALRGVYARNLVYADVEDWKCFEPALTRAEQMNVDEIWACAESIPPEWYEHDVDGLERLVETLMSRRNRIRELIAGFRDSSRQPFPQWKQRAVAVT
jgi:hypothetical protein